VCSRTTQSALAGSGRDDGPARGPATALGASWSSEPIALEEWMSPMKRFVSVVVVVVAFSAIGVGLGPIASLHPTKVTIDRPTRWE
jgi:hypothetical protein